MTKEQEFRKQTEEAKFEAFSLMCEKIAYLEKENAELKKQVEQKQHLADVRLEQSLENYKLFSDERKERIDIDIALEDMTDNFTKAKKLLAKWVELYKPKLEGFPKPPIQVDTEQFLKDLEK